MLDYSNRLIGEEQIRKLSAAECYVLIMACYLHELGVDDASIVRERRARNTHETIALSCELLDKLGFDGQRCVVSSDYHLWRALRDARKLGFELTPVAAPTPRASIPQQWCREALTIMSGR